MKVEFKPRERIKLDGIVWAVERRVTTGFQLVGVGDGALRILTDQELLDHWDGGRLERLRPNLSSDDHSVLNPVDRDFIAYSENDRAEAERRCRYVECVTQLLGAPPYANFRLLGIIPQVAEKIGDRKPPSARTLRRWIAVAGRAGPDVRAQIPQNFNRGNRKMRFPATVEQIAREVFEEYLMRPAPSSIKETYSTFRFRIENENLVYPHGRLPMPSQATWYRWAAKLDDEERIAAQRGRRTADQKYLAINQGPAELVPMATVEIDHTYIDCQVVDDQGILLGRPTLTVAIDRATRMCVGFVLTWEPPSYLCAMLLLRHVIRPKTYVQQIFPKVRNDWPCCGVPRAIVIDNGMEFHSRHLKDACLQLGISLEYAPTKEPRYRGRVERFFRTLNDKLIHFLPGTTLSRIDRSSDYDASRAARVTPSQVNELLHKFMVDVYAPGFHRGLKDIPIEAWRRGVELHPLRLPASIKDLDILTCGGDRRKIGRQGIEIFSLFYNSPELASLRVQCKGNPTVDIRYDPTDIGSIWIADPKRGRHIRVPCSAAAYAAGRTLWQHKRVLEQLGEKKRGATERHLHQAIAELRQSIDRTFGSAAGRKRTKKRAARFIEQPATPDRLAGFGQAYPAYASIEEALSTAESGGPASGDTMPAPVNPFPQAVHSEKPAGQDETAAQHPETADAHPSVDLDDMIQKHGFTARRLP